MLGKEASIFLPSATMANAIACRLHTKPGEAIICDARCHILNAETGGLAVHAGIVPRIVHGHRGHFTPEQVAEQLTLSGHYRPITTLLACEQTHNAAGGTIWPLEQLQAVRTFLTYKAEERGCTVVAVDPRHTSQTCSRCGHQARNNRRSRSRFGCRACGFELHADLIGARNIAAKYLPSRGISPTGAPSSTGVSSPLQCAVRQHASPEVRDKLPALAGSR